MSQNSSDLRVRRTQKLLREALIALIEERSFDAITVGEIAERAMVSRAAFYRHYQDKYDLVEKIFEVVRNVSAQGVTVLLVEQNAKLALQAAHRGYVMDSGLVTMSGNAKDMLDDPRVKAAYLGE